jgi:hypothetical protein
MTQRITTGCAVAALCLISLLTRADVFVDATVSPIGGGAYHYEFAVSNTGPEDALVVALNDAPPGDLMIKPSLVAPAGFLSSYDSGIGFVDFLADTDLFATGTTVSGFSFDSLGSPPTYLTTFEGLTINGNSFSGRIRYVPEAGNTLILAGISLGALGVFRRRLLTFTTPN